MIYWLIVVVAITIIGGIMSLIEDGVEGVVLCTSTLPPMIWAIVKLWNV